MIICKVIGHVWATKKEPALEGQKLMVVQQMETDTIHVAADVVGAGIGEQVLVVTGSTARGVFKNGNVPADMAIVGIIDNLEIDSNVR